MGLKPLLVPPCNSGAQYRPYPPRITVLLARLKARPTRGENLVLVGSQHEVGFPFSPAYSSVPFGVMPETFWAIGLVAFRSKPTMMALLRSASPVSHS